MKKLFGQMAADRKWQARGTTSRQCESEKNSVAWRNFALAEKVCETCKTKATVAVDRDAVT